MKPQEAKLWQTRFATLDTLYRGRMKKWQALLNIYDLDFEKRIRDLTPKQLVRVSIFYPRVRQIIAAIAYNYPKLFFTIEDEDATTDQGEVLERAASAFLRIARTRETAWQVIFDALFCSVGWADMDFNRSDDALNDPNAKSNLTGANAVDHPDQLDLVNVTRRPPGHIHVDPLCSPESIRFASYIRERKWIRTEWLMNDPRTKEHLKKEIKATGTEANDELAMGEMSRPDTDEADELQAKKEMLTAGDFTLCDIVHDKTNRMRHLFCSGIEQPVQEEDHPYSRRVFEQRTDGLGSLLFEEDERTPLLDLDKSAPAPGWLVTDGFSLKPMRFDLHGSSFYPEAHMEYLKDLQYVVVESMSRQSILLKRTSRQGVINRAEVTKRPGIVKEIQDGVDNQYHVLEDVNSIKTLDQPVIPVEQMQLEDRAMGHVDQISSVSDFSGPSGPVRSATADSLEAAANNVNKEWMDTHVGGWYEDVTRDGLTIMSDPRYKPERFELNVSPQGAEKVVRALTGADFMWNYKIETKAGSMSPLVEQLEQREYRQFYDLAIQSPNFDRMELDKKYLRDDINEDARQAAALVLDRVMTQIELGIEGLVVEGLDHQAHIETYSSYQQHPVYQQLSQQANGPFESAQFARQQIAQIDQAMQQLMQQHQQLQEGEEVGASASGGSAGAGNIQSPADVLQSQVQSNAQNISSAVTADAREGL
jgi:hypothetical protein